MRAGDVPVCTQVRVLRVSTNGLCVTDDQVEAWVPRSQVHSGGDVEADAHVGDRGVMVIPQWLAQDRGLRFW